MLNWIKNQPYQQYFSTVILLTDEKSSDSIQRLYMSFFDCKEMIFDKEYAFTNYASDPSKSIRFKNFDELIKFINDIIFDDCVRNGSSFIFCYYGKDLFFKTLPINAKLNKISLQQYYLEFIDLRNELYEFMMRDFPFINSQLQGDFDRLLPLMCAALKIFNTGTDYLKNQHDCLKQIIVLLLQNQHNFNFPTIINPQIIYGQKLYLNPPWYNKLPQAVQDVRYLRIRGIPFNYSKKDIIDFYEFQQFNTSDITLKENDQGLFNGEIIMRFEDETQYDKVRKSDKFYMKNRYIEVFESTVDEFKQDNEPQKPQGKSQSQQLHYLKLRGLPWSCGRKEIKTFLGDNKWIKQIDIMYEKNGRAKGECFVVVDNETECENLKYKYDKKNLGNRYVEIFISSSKEYNNAVRPKGQSKSRSRSGSPFKNNK